eukprot:8587071-Ditylum_brightwellii.AAC.1
MHGPPPEQVEDENDDSTYVPQKSDPESDDNDADDTSIPSIDSIQGAPIHHNVDNVEPLTNTTATTHHENNDETDDNAFTAGVNMQHKENESSSEEEHGSEEEPSQMAGVQQDDHSCDQMEEVEEDTMEDETLQAKINERDDW